MQNSEICGVVAEQDMESGNFHTVDLGINSQPSTRIEDQNLRFRVGNNSSTNQKSNTSKTSSKTYQEKRNPANQGLSRVLSEVNTNPNQLVFAAAVKPNAPGKENTVMTFEATKQNPSQAIPQADKQSHKVVLETQPHRSHDTIASSSTDSPALSANRENPLCGETYERSIHGHSEPPDPHSGGQDGLVGGSLIGDAGVGIDTVATQ